MQDTFSDGGSRARESADEVDVSIGTLRALVEALETEGHRAVVHMQVVACRLYRTQ